MRHKRTIRSELISNRENQPNYRRRTISQSFGVYRPLKPESAMSIGNVLLEAQKDIKDYFEQLGWNPVPEIKKQNELGVTFVQRNSVQAAIRLGLAGRGFNFSNKMAQIESFARLQTSKTDVPINGFSWFGRNNRRLAAEIDTTSESYGELIEQQEAVDELLNESNNEASNIRVYAPDHCSVFKLLQASKTYLSWRNQNEIAAIVQTHFDAAEIGSIALGGMVVGETYNKPHPLLMAA